MVPKASQTGPKIDEKSIKNWSNIDSEVGWGFLVIFVWFFDEKLVQKLIIFWLCANATLRVVHMRKSLKYIENTMVFEGFAFLEYT